MLVFSIIFSTYLNYNLYKLGAAKHEEATFTHTHTESVWGFSFSIFFSSTIFMYFLFPLPVVFSTPFFKGIYFPSPFLFYSFLITFQQIQEGSK